jgi:hypothetical protein
MLIIKKERKEGEMQEGSLDLSHAHLALLGMMVMA